MPDSPNAASRQAAAALQWLGLPGVVLLAALLCDLAITVSASFDGIGATGSDLLLLPGILALSACALWARRQPVSAAWAGAGVLVASSVLIRLTPATPYTALLANISFAETVAGLELVFFCVRAVRGGPAFVTTLTVVVAGLIAVTGREPMITARTLFQPLLTGFVLLALTVVAALQLRKPVPTRTRNDVTKLLSAQWPLVGVLTLTLFLDTYFAASAGLIGIFVLATSAGAAVAALLAARYPMQSALGLAGLMFLCSLALNLTYVRDPYVSLGGFPLTQVVAGVAVVVFLVRQVRPAQAAGGIAVLTVVVAAGAVSAVPTRDADSLRGLFVATLLLLGVAVATGLFLKARDSERTQAVEAAVSEAQTAERMALARELHDVVAHHVTGIVVQAQAARMLAEQDPRVVADSLGQIERAGGEALTAMRRLVRSMRGDAPAGSSELSEQATTELAADLRRLVEAGNHGVPTETDLDLPPDLPQEVARSALRLVQESLTNIGKHANGATRVLVSVRVTAGELHIRVSDDGRAEPSAGGSSGYGLIGMRERVELLHGRLSAGPGPAGGWVVEAWLPLGEGAE
ncbi:sensor histidine kinase [Qaidamihabitans albus]|uniref:sensor histidine kinase n=1 Tax=Qaidamihabitans albus TaxID=2795733 RepID=UPI0018F20184|nr:sensor histidine kinase [Qaidamihabitans albus]